MGHAWPLRNPGPAPVATWDGPRLSAKPPKRSVVNPTGFVQKPRVGVQVPNTLRAMAAPESEAGCGQCQAARFPPCTSLHFSVVLPRVCMTFPIETFVLQWFWIHVRASEAGKKKPHTFLGFLGFLFKKATPDYSELNSVHPRFGEILHGSPAEKSPRIPYPPNLTTHRVRTLTEVEAFVKKWQNSHRQNVQPEVTSGPRDRGWRRCGAGADFSLILVWASGSGFYVCGSDGNLFLKNF